MKKRVIPILISIIVILLVILAFILGANTGVIRSKKNVTSVRTEKVTSRKSSQAQSSVQPTSSTEQSDSSSISDKLNVSDLTPKQIAALVAYHGSTIGNNNWQAWGTYQDAMNNGVTSTNQIYVLNQSQCPVNISQPGNGKIYSYTDQGGVQNFYTLGNDGKTVYIYCFEQNENGDDDTQQPVETTTLQDMVNQANADLMTSEIKNVANTINIKDCE